MLMITSIWRSGYFKFELQTPNLKVKDTVYILELATNHSLLHVFNLEVLSEFHVQMTIVTSFCVCFEGALSLWFLFHQVPCQLQVKDLNLALRPEFLR